jgi:hypothetical protein
LEEHGQDFRDEFETGSTCFIIRVGDGEFERTTDVVNYTGTAVPEMPLYHALDVGNFVLLLKLFS